MNISVITLFPEMFTALNCGVTGRAIEKKIVNIKYFNPRDYTHDKYRRVDDRPYGGGPGMVMMAQPLQDAILAAKQQYNGNAHTIHLTPQGTLLTQDKIKSFNKTMPLPLILVAGRYEGIDERIIEAQIDEEISIGDYVLSGGELAAMVIIDAVTRLLPGALGHEDSAQQDSFMDGLLDYPHYTRPEIFNGQKVPNVLLSGDHKQIKEWRLNQALERTRLRRPDLLKKRGKT